VPTADTVNDRGMMGDGIIDIPRIRAAVEAQGFGGCVEVEIFSNRWWSAPMDEVIATAIARMKTAV
jgi:sugar phosphate isomerase/epimerase